MESPKKFEIIDRYIIEELHGHRMIVAEVPCYSERHKPLLSAAPEMRDALALAERAINESVSGVRKVDLAEWGQILAVMQAALGKAEEQV